MPWKILAIGLLTVALSAIAEEGTPVTYEVSGLPYEGYYVNAGADAPLVLLLHDWDGLTDYEIRRSQMLARLGYSVFAADLFGKGVRPTSDSDKRQHTGELYNDRTKLRAIMAGALDKAKNLGGNTDNAVAMGYCFGGAAALELARSGTDLKGFVLFHGGLGTPQDQDYSQVTSEILVMHGTADTAIPMTAFANLATRLEDAGVAHEMISYGGADHAFTVFGSHRYQETADKRSWQRFLDFLAIKLDS